LTLTDVFSRYLLKCEGLSNEKGPGVRAQLELAFRVTLKAEATKPPQADMASQQRVFDVFRADFNRCRPHEALEQRTPHSVYCRSHRPFPVVLKHPEYPSSWLVRSTDTGGVLYIRGRRLRIAHALNCTRVGLEPITEDCWRVFYGPLAAGFIDARNQEPRFSTVAPSGVGVSSPLSVNAAA
jgi:hypothetical protein